MPRLRVTTVLSLLALLIGILGTGWLSAWTDDWVGPTGRSVSRVAVRARHAATHRRLHGIPHVVGAQAEVLAQTPPAPLPPSPVPVSTPASPGRYADLRGHLDGRVVLDITTDHSGQVIGARVARSSGDPILDAYALATVRQWRFAVPADLPGGVHGQLPMRFDSGPPPTPP